VAALCASQSSTAHSPLTTPGFARGPEVRRPAHLNQQVHSTTWPRRCAIKHSPLSTAPRLWPRLRSWHTRPCAPPPLSLPHKRQPTLPTGVGQPRPPRRIWLRSQASLCECSPPHRPSLVRTTPLALHNAQGEAARHCNCESLVATASVNASRSLKRHLGPRRGPFCQPPRPFLPTSATSSATRLMSALSLRIASSHISFALSATSSRLSPFSQLCRQTGL